jgi:hypothetical protein
LFDDISIEGGSQRREVVKGGTRGTGKTMEGSVDARFPHLKQPFREMLYAIYKRSKKITIYNYTSSFFDFCFDFKRRLVVNLSN